METCKRNGHTDVLLIDHSNGHGFLNKRDLLLLTNLMLNASNTKRKVIMKTPFRINTQSSNTAESIYHK